MHLTQLTQWQVQALVDTIKEDFEKKKEEFKKSKEYKRALEKAKVDVEYNEAIELIKRLKYLEKEKRKIDDEINYVLVEFGKKTKLNTYSNSTLEQRLNDLVDYIANKEVGPKIPSEKDIRSTIIIAALSDSDDILDKVREKFELS